MDKKLDPAFPLDGNHIDKLSVMNFDPSGMTKRFYAACAAMTGLLSGKYYNTLVNSPTDRVEDGFPEPISICEEAYVFADELLKQEDL